MKKITLLFTFLATFSLTAQTIIFEDDFESYTDFAISGVGSWTLLDEDGLNTYGFTGITFPSSGVAKSFQVFNSTSTTPVLTPSATSNWEGYNGSLKGMVCFASVPSGGNYNDDWLISPQITLAASGNTLTFWYKACDATYSIEEFTVGISTTGTAPADFTVVSANPVSIANGDITWHQYTYAFPPTYNNANIYVGINCVSQDQFGFMVDDFSVSTSLLSVDEFAFNACQVSCKDKVVTISNNHGEADYKIYSLTGQTVMEGATRLESLSIDASNLSSGIYVVEVNDSATNAVIKKKIAI